REKGVTLPPFVKEARPELVARVEPILAQMVKLHASTPPAVGATNEEIAEFRKRALEADMASLTKLRPAFLERDIYVWFGCVVPLDRFASDPKGAYEHAVAAVGLSLTEQRERMLDLVDELLGTTVERACPPNKHYEDWDVDGLKAAYKSLTRVDATGIDDIVDSH